MIYYGLELHSLDTYFQYKNITAPGTPQAGEIRVYAKDKSGTSALYLKDDAGTEREIAPGAAVTGTGTANRYAYWSSSSVIAAASAFTAGRVPFGDSSGLLTESGNLAWDDTNGTLTVKNALAGSGQAQSLVLDTTSSSRNTGIQWKSGGTAAYDIHIDATTGKLQVFCSVAALSALQFDTSRNTIVGTGAVATNATAPFLNLNSCAGTPTGSPSPAAGQVPLVYDTTNNKLYAYNSAWKDLTGGSGSGALSGSGTSSYVTFWNGTNSLSADSAFTWDSANHRALIGTINGSVDRALVVSAAGATQPLGIHSYSGGASSPLAGIVFRGARQSAGSPSAVATDDFIMVLASQGYGATGFTGSRRAALISRASEGWTDSAQGTYLTFETTATGGTTTAERFRIGPSGQLGIGGATYGSSGDIFSSGGASAAPTWVTRATLNAALDHGTLGGLGDDDHTIYALLAGRSGGQTLIGGTAASNNLTLKSTSNATKGNIVFGSSAAIDEVNSLMTLGGTTFASNQGKLLIIGTITNSNSGQSGFAVTNTFNGSAGGAAGEMYSFQLVPVFTPSGSIAYAGGFRADATFSPGSGITITDCQGGRLIPITGSTSGAITNLAGLQLLPSYGSLKPTNAYGLDVLNFGSSSITKAVGIRIIKPTSATNNYYMEFDTADGTDPTGGGGAAAGRIPCLIGGVLRYLAYY